MDVSFFFTEKPGSAFIMNALLHNDPERARTSGLQIRNLSLYPLSYGIRHN
jgi:hypothetical protein